MSQFTTIRLTNNRVLVRGTDFTGQFGETVLDASQWEFAKSQVQVREDQERFDDAVEEFFKPITEAAETLAKAQGRQPEDPSTFVVLAEAQEAQEASPAKEAHIFHLSPDNVVVRLLEEGHHDRLIWVGGTLEVLQAGVLEELRAEFDTQGSDPEGFFATPAQTEESEGWAEPVPERLEPEPNEG